MTIYTQLSPTDYPSVLRRPAMDTSVLFDSVKTILSDIKKNGDEAVRRYAQQFDGFESDLFKVTEAEIEAAENSLTDDLKTAIRTAHTNITRFHEKQLTQPEAIETMRGVTCWRRSVGIERVGLYIPGGTAPLFSTVLMLGIPARLAQCQEVVLCSPPTGGYIHPAILYAAKVCGIQSIFKLGGVQAIGAMAYGTESVPQVYKIFGPGNQYVTAAKQLMSIEGIAIDMPAGPSEVMVIADHTARPAFVAADLLSQAEHGADSQVVLLTYNEEMIHSILNEINQQLKILPRADMAQKALSNSVAIVVADDDEALKIANYYAPEHLILATDNADDLAGKVVNAGSVFIGHYSPEAVGDYASGTNHTLPTNGFAKAYSGVSVDSFVKKITFQRLSTEGVISIAKTVMTMAEAEQLRAHAKAVSVRIDSLEVGE